MSYIVKNACSYCIICPSFGRIGKKTMHSTIGLRVFHGGNFITKKGVVIYELGGMIIHPDLHPNDFNFSLVHSLVSADFCGQSGFKIWYRKYGKSLGTGRKVMLGDDDVRDLLRSMDKSHMVSIYVVFDGDGKKVGQGESLASFNTSGTTIVNAPTKTSPIKPSTNEPYFTPTHLHKERPPKLESWKKKTPKIEPNPLHISPLRRSPRLPPVIIQSTPSPPKQTTRSATLLPNSPFRRSPRLSALLIESTPSPPKQTTPSQQPKPSKNITRTTKSKKKSVAKRRKKSDLSEDSEADYVDGLSDLESGSDFGSDVEVAVNDFDDKIGEDLFAAYVGRYVPGFNVDLGGVSESRERAALKLGKELEGKFDFQDEVVYESDDNRSLDGSDGEVTIYPSFNEETDLTGPIKLKVGLKFDSVDTLRKAVSEHSVQQGYDFYTLHNNRSHYTAYCVNKCECPWNNKRAKRVACVCGKNLCGFKVYARKMKGEDSIQIKTLRLKHKCGFQSRNRKVTAPYLARKYLEHFRSDPSWSLKKGLQPTVMRDLGVHVEYSKCWHARAIAKLMLYGDNAEQYRRVWDYVNAVKKHNEGSIAIVCCDSIERPPPIFQRIFIALKPVIEGFKNGCRPIIGLDGCHLTGSYPGMLLVAVGCDGNNNIYPLAWAVVDIEKTDTWTWFIDILAQALGTSDGAGYTFMSDRQKVMICCLFYFFLFKSCKFHNIVLVQCCRDCWRPFKMLSPRQ